MASEERPRTGESSGSNPNKLKKERPGQKNSSSAHTARHHVEQPSDVAIRLPSPNILPIPPDAPGRTRVTSRGFQVPPINFSYRAPEPSHHEDSYISQPQQSTLDLHPRGYVDQSNYARFPRPPPNMPQANLLPPNRPIQYRDDNAFPANGRNFRRYPSVVTPREPSRNSSRSSAVRLVVSFTLSYIPSNALWCSID
jgi:hypothetical protein